MVVLHKVRLRGHSCSATFVKLIKIWLTSRPFKCFPPNSNQIFYCRVPDVANRCRASEFARLTKVEYNDTIQQDSTRFIEGLAEPLVHHLR